MACINEASACFNMLQSSGKRVLFTKRFAVTETRFQMPPVSVIFLASLSKSFLLSAAQNNLSASRSLAMDTLQLTRTHALSGANLSTSIHMRNFVEINTLLY